jgi:hypothetical protein
MAVWQPVGRLGLGGSAAVCHCRHTNPTSPSPWAAATGLAAAPGLARGAARGAAPPLLLPPTRLRATSAVPSFVIFSRPVAECTGSDFWTRVRSLSVTKRCLFAGMASARVIFLNIRNAKWRVLPSLFSEASETGPTSGTLPVFDIEVTDFDIRICPYRSHQTSISKLCILTSI